MSRTGRRHTLYKKRYNSKEDLKDSRVVILKNGLRGDNKELKRAMNSLEEKSRDVFYGLEEKRKKRRGRRLIAKPSRFSKSAEEFTEENYESSIKKYQRPA